MEYLDLAGLTRFHTGLRNKFLLQANVANNLTTTASGKALDARQGKALSDLVATNATAIGQSASPYVHTKTGTVHNFAGTGKLGFATLVADYADDDTFTVNGTAVTVVGDESALKTGGSVLFSLDGTTLYLYKTANVFEIPDGASALPVNNVKIWVECAGLNYESAGSPTLESIVVNSNLCATLMNSQNAVNYMIRSTAIQTAVLGSTTAIAALDASSPWTSPIMTSATTPVGYSVTANSQNQGLAYYITSLTNYWEATTGNVDSWCTLQIPVDLWVYKICMHQYGTGTMVRHFYGSTDGESWTDIVSPFTGTAANADIDFELIALPSTTKYRYIKLYNVGNRMKTSKLKIYGRTMEV